MSTPKQNKELLGKGIRSLLQSIDADLKTSSGQLKQNVVENATATNRISVEEVQANPKQPRRDFDEQSLNELAESIRMHVIIQPITVTKLPTGKYRLISGERRSVRIIAGTSLIMVVFSILPFFFGQFGLIYLITASIFGVVMVLLSIWLLIKPSEKASWTVFKFSSPYLTALFIGFMVDALFH